MSTTRTAMKITPIKFKKKLHKDHQKLQQNKGEHALITLYTTYIMYITQNKWLCNT